MTVMRSIIVHSAMVIAAALAMLKIGGLLFVEFRPKQFVYAAMFAYFAILFWSKRKPKSRA